MNKLMLIAVTMLACLPAAAGAGVIYKWDDGTGETYGGAGGAYLAWMVQFTVQTGGERINAVEISLHEVGLFDFEAVVWEDIGGHGDPADARVLSRTPFDGIVGWNTIPITPVAVSGSFFVGAYSPNADYPVDVDIQKGSRFWMSANSAGLNLNDLTNVDPDTGTAYWLDGYVAMVRAQATPEPATMALLAAGCAAALLRKRRK